MCVQKPNAGFKRTWTDCCQLSKNIPRWHQNHWWTTENETLNPANNQPLLWSKQARSIQLNWLVFNMEECMFHNGGCAHRGTDIHLLPLNVCCFLQMQNSGGVFPASTRLFFSTSTSSNFRARTVACSFEDGGKIAPSHTFLPPWCWVMGRLSTFIPLLTALNSSQHARMTVLTDPTCSRTSPSPDLRGGGSLFCWPAAPATGATLRASPTTSCHSAENVEKAEDTKRETPTSGAAEMFVSLFFSL